ncbi:hypothetical protein Btru_064255, partial [Bulinus truncatus]
NENALKKKLQKFLWELANFGTVRGFKHFTCYLRGKEELIVSVKNKIKGSSPSLIHSTLPPPAFKKPLCATDSFNSFNLPYDKGSLVHSLQSQTLLRGRQDREEDLLPASPSEEETLLEADVTLFLIAGYARYACPYVWVRSNHDRLFKLSGDKDDDRDSPLKLKSTARWKDEDVKIFDIVAEIVKLCTYPAPRNPFEIDFDYFNFLKPADQLLASGAMTCLLQKIVIQTSENKVYIAKVVEELKLVSRIHFKSLREITQDGKITVLNQKKKEQERQLSQHALGKYEKKNTFKVETHPLSVSNPKLATQQPHSNAEKNYETAPSLHQNIPVNNSLCQHGLLNHVQTPHSSSSIQYQKMIPGQSVSFTSTTQLQTPQPMTLMTPSSITHVQSHSQLPSNVLGITYGKGPRGAFPGGYDRMPAPSML